MNKALVVVDKNSYKVDNNDMIGCLWEYEYYAINPKYCLSTIKYRWGQSKYLSNQQISFCFG